MDPQALFEQFIGAMPSTLGYLIALVGSAVVLKGAVATAWSIVGHLYAAFLRPLKNLPKAYGQWAGELTCEDNA